jgi:enamine deaminase RidA (YjgF/YER057c/UK114 family)
MAVTVRFSNPKTLVPPPGYSYVVEVSSKRLRTIYFAGQLGLDTGNKLVGAPGDFRAQCVKAFDNMTLALKAAGA